MKGAGVAEAIQIACAYDAIHFPHSHDLPRPFISLESGPPPWPNVHHLGHFYTDNSINPKFTTSTLLNLKQVYSQPYFPKLRLPQKCNGQSHYLRWRHFSDFLISGWQSTRGSLAQTHHPMPTNTNRCLAHFRFGKKRLCLWSRSSWISGKSLKISETYIWEEKKQKKWKSRIEKNFNSKRDFIMNSAQANEKSLHAIWIREYVSSFSALLYVNIFLRQQFPLWKTKR